jgi:catechol 2,3-dioxygenase-like lactoylglutathione lyase family enzyme
MLYRDPTPEMSGYQDMRYLHTMVRVTDVDASLDFYCDKLGLEEVRRIDNASR